MVLDHANGKFYGTTNTDGAHGDGTIFQYDPTTNTFTTLWSFSGGDGANPQGNLVVSGGSLYGTTYAGGPQGNGTIFKFNLSAPAVTTLHFFNGSDGLNPSGDIAVDSSGNVYGTTQGGGTNSSGSVYELAGGVLSTLFSFGTNASHYVPNGVLLDGSGNLFGTTYNGGATDNGLVWEISSGQFSTLYAFPGDAGGSNPFGGLYEDSSGTLWGTTEDGGTRYVGIVYKLTTTAPAPHLAFIQQPATTTAGTVISPGVQVAIEDASGNVLTGDSSNVTIALTNANGATLGGTLTVQAHSGVATFSDLSIQKAGGYTLTASDPTDGLTAPSGTFTIAPAAASKLVYITQPASAAAGASLGSVAVAIEDQFGNIETGDNSSVTIAVNSGPGALSGTTMVAASSGVATFSNLSLTTAGSYTLAAADATDALSGVISSSITISAATASKLVYISQPASAIAGTNLGSVTIAVEDQYGNIETSDNSNVTLAVNSGPGSLAGTTTVAASSGVATFTSLSLATAGTYVLKASDTADALSGFNSNSFTISPAAASKLVFVQQPTNTTIGVAIHPAVTVDVVDQFGNLIANDNSSVTIGVASGPGTLGGTTTVTASAGVATFSNLTLGTAGTYTLAPSDGALAAASSGSFVVSPVVSTAVKLAFIQQPVGSGRNGTLNPVKVAIEDASGNIVTSNNSIVTLSIYSGPRGSVLSGTLSVRAVSGIAVFSNLRLSKAGTYNLRLSIPFSLPSFQTDL